MRKLLLAILFLLLSTQVQAGEGTVKKSFYVKTNLEELSEAIVTPDVANRLFEAAHTTIITNVAKDQKEVEKETPKGNFRFTVKQTIVKQGDKVTILNKLVSTKSHLASHYTEIVLEKNRRGGCSVTVTLSSKVNSGNISNLEVTTDASNSILRMKKVLRGVD